MEGYTFSLLVPSYAHAYLVLFKDSVIDLVLQSCGSSQDFRSFRKFHHFKHIYVLESLIFLLVCLGPLLSVGAGHGLLEILGRTVRINAGG